MQKIYHAKKPYDDDDELNFLLVIKINKWVNSKQLYSPVWQLQQLLFTLCYISM